MPPPRPAPAPRKPKKQQPTGAEIVARARTWLGVPYLFGGTTRKGVDCSGLVMNVGEEVGLSPPRTSEEQWAWCQHISASEAGPGDLVFFVGAEIDPPPGHVGILVSPGVMIDAPHTGAVVSQTHFADGPGVNRIIGYGRMRGAKKSTSSNPFTEVGNTGGTTTSIGGEFGAAAASFIIVICVILLLILAFAALVGAGMLFKGR